MSHTKDNKGQFLGLSPKASFIAGLATGILVLCSVGFFILLGTVVRNGGLFAIKTPTVAAATTTPTPTATAPAPTAALTAQDVAPVTSSDHIFGDPNASVTLIEYSDFECPYCKQFHPSLAQLMTEYQGKVRWVYRHYPLSFHQNAEKEAEAAECIAEQGGDKAFWDYASKIFDRTTSNGTGFALDKLPDLAQEVGVNKAKFQDCLNSGKYSSVVAQDEQTGVTAGVQGTPGTIVMNSSGKVQLVEGAVSYAQLKQVVDSMF